MRAPLGNGAGLGRFAFLRLRAERLQKILGRLQVAFDRLFDGIGVLLDRAKLRAETPSLARIVGGTTRKAFCNAKDPIPSFDFTLYADFVFGIRVLDSDPADKPAEKQENEAKNRDVGAKRAKLRHGRSVP